VSRGPSRVGEERGEGLHPPIDRDVIDLDAPLGDEFLKVAEGERVAQVPAHRENNDLGREPEPLERRSRCSD
jgi:hypothetical protein